MRETICFYPSAAQHYACTIELFILFCITGFEKCHTKITRQNLKRLQQIRIPNQIQRQLFLIAQSRTHDDVYPYETSIKCKLVLPILCARPADCHRLKSFEIIGSPYSVNAAAPPHSVISGFCFSFQQFKFVTAIIMELNVCSAVPSLFVGAVFQLLYNMRQEESVQTFIYKFKLLENKIYS